MKYFDAFSGYGGFHLGIERALDDNIRPNELADSQRPKELHKSEDKQLKWECVGYSEIDKYASAVYKYHFGGKNYGDITKIDPTTIPDFDLFVGGFPCQAFSIAGKRMGFEETRGTLFFDIARILKDKHPRYVLLENVKGLLSHDAGRSFKVIISTLAELGYSVEWQVLNAKNFGVPQNRERVFIIGHLGGFGGRQVFPIRESNPTALKQVIGGSQGYRTYDPSGIAVTQASQAGGVGAKTGLYAVDMTLREPTGHRIRKDGRAGTLDANYYKGIANQERPGVLENSRIRRLTPTECERLMGLPDGWTSKGDFEEIVDDNGKKYNSLLKAYKQAPTPFIHSGITTREISDSQRYKLCGNGVVVNVVEEVIKRLLT